MSQLIFAQAKAIRKKAKKACEGYHDDKEFCEKIYDSVIKRERNEFCEILKIAALLHDDYLEISGKHTTNWYFISIRPDPQVTFKAFHTQVCKFIQRACIIDFQLSYEQKSEEGSGEGFHTHIVCNTNHRSKGECLRDTLSSFKKICQPQCIQVETTREPQKIVDAYLIAYESKDGHKLKTKNGDALWRANNHIKDIYLKENLEDLLTLSIKSKTVSDKITNFIVEME